MTLKIGGKTPRRNEKPVFLFFIATLIIGKLFLCSML